ncbi:MAG: hypothetical protein AB7T59_15470 [Hyphomonadaceae bacterium]
MSELRRITVDVDPKMLEAAREGDADVAETVRQALERQARALAWKRLLAFRGKVDEDR